MNTKFYPQTFVVFSVITLSAIATGHSVQAQTPTAADLSGTQANEVAQIPTEPSPSV